MSCRITDCDKWKDTWFSELSTVAKLLFIFLCENCDNAGVYEIDKKHLLFYLGVNESELRSAIIEISKVYVKSNDKKRIWIKNFLKYQKKLPLNNINNNHKNVIQLINSYLNDETKFKGCEEMSVLLPDFPEREPKKAKTVTKTIIKEIIITPEMIPAPAPTIPVEEKPKRQIVRNTFVKPEVEDIKQYMISQNFKPYDTECQRFYDFYEGNGWKIGKNSMKDWKATIRNWIINHNERTRTNMHSKISKIDVVQESHQSLEQVDWNEFYKDK